MFSVRSVANPDPCFPCVPWLNQIRVFRAFRGYTRSVKRLSVALALLAASVATAQRAPLRSSVELTVVTATVRDADGKLVTGLPREAFEVYEDGVRVPIAQFTNERVPLGLGLLLDISDSMFGRRIKDAEAAVERFLVTLLDSKDAFFVMAFNHEARLLFGWKTDPSGVHDALARLQPTGSTAIYDAIVRSLPLIENRPRERAAIVLITDGADTASDTTLHDLRPALGVGGAEGLRGRFEDRAVQVSCRGHARPRCDGEGTQPAATRRRVTAPCVRPPCRWRPG